MIHSMLTPSDVREALAEARPRCIIPYVAIPACGETNINATTNVTYSVRTTAAGAYVTVSDGPIFLSRYVRRPKGSFRKSVDRMLSKLRNAVRILQRLAERREACDKAVEGYLQHYKGTNVRDRKRTATVIRLARNLTGLPGYEGTMYCNMSIAVCDRLIAHTTTH